MENNIKNGVDTLLEIDTQGASLVKKQYPDGVYIFIAPPDFKTLESRLRGRKTDSEESILRRLNLFQSEIQKIPMYDYVVVNDSVDSAVEKVRAILTAEHLRFEHTLTYTNLFSEDDSL